MALLIKFLSFRYFNRNEFYTLIFCELALNVLKEAISIIECHSTPWCTRHHFLLFKLKLRSLDLVTFEKHRRLDLFHLMWVRQAKPSQQ